MLVQILLLMASCASCWRTGEKKFEIAQTEFNKALEELIVLKSEGKLDLQEVEDANKVLRKISASLSVWRQSVLDDKLQGYEVAHRPDMELLIDVSMKRLEKYRSRQVNKRPVKQHTHTHEHE